MQYVTNYYDDEIKYKITDKYYGRIKFEERYYNKDEKESLKNRPLFADNCFDVYHKIIKTSNTPVAWQAWFLDVVESVIYESRPANWDRATDQYGIKNLLNWRLKKSNYKITDNYSVIKLNTKNFFL